MSTGQTIGSILGFTLGAVLAPFTFGGSWFAGGMIGMSLGGAIGGYLDSTSPELGSPATEKFDYTRATEGIPIPDLLGTSKLPGNVIGYWNNRSVQVVQQTAVGGKGGNPSSGTSTVGYKYYLTWAIGIIMGPCDVLYAIYEDNENVIWSGELVIPESGGQETITLTKDNQTIGQATFYFGTSDQTVNSIIKGYIDSDTSLQGTCPAYKGLCYIVFDDCYIGDYNRAPNYSFVLKKSPVIEELEDQYREIDLMDYNPAHAIWYILHEKRKLDASWFDIPSFNSAAQTLYNERLGIGLLMRDYQKASSYLESILSTIDGVLRYSSDGKIHLHLMRGDTPYDELPLLTEEDTTELPSFARRAWLDTINQVQVTFSERNVVPIFASATGGGIIVPSGNVLVEIGTQPEFSFVPYAGKKIDKVLVDDIEVTLSVKSTGLKYYAWPEEVAEEHTIVAEFTDDPEYEYPEPPVLPEEGGDEGGVG